MGYVQYDPVKHKGLQLYQIQTIVKPDVTISVMVPSPIPPPMASKFAMYLFVNEDESKELSMKEIVMCVKESQPKQDYAMQAQLSRRAAAVMHSSTIADLDSNKHYQFVMAVMNANGWSDLDSEWRDLILKAERELKVKGTGLGV